MSTEMATGQEQPPRTGARLPLVQPTLTYILLVVIVLVFLLESLFGGSTNMRTLQGLGAQVNALVAAGQYSRLLTAMFLHIGVAHLAFNGWALYTLGRDVEAFYGHGRFAAIYLLSGLAGGVAYYVLGPRNVLSAGASGAIFGLVGAEGALFLANRTLFGTMGRQRLWNLGILVVINLALGATTPGINNMAHVGGFLCGVALGLGLAPRYQVVWEWSDSGPISRLRNRVPIWIQAGTIGAGILVLLAGIWLGNRL